MDKFADAKVCGPAGAALLAVGESIGINGVALRVVGAAGGHRSPKVQAEALAWLGQAVTAFGMPSCGCLVSVSLACLHGYVVCPCLCLNVLCLHACVCLSLALFCLQPRARVLAVLLLFSILVPRYLF